MKILGEEAALRVPIGGDDGGVGPYGLAEVPMKQALALLALPLAMTALSGCLTQVSPSEDSGSVGILWREGYEAARDEAREMGRPMLVVMVAGALRDKC
jgi:hypothetical protein